MNKRPTELFDYAVFVWVSFPKEWDQAGYIVSSKDEHLLRDYVKALLSDPETRFVAVEKQVGNVGPFFEYWTGSNGNVRKYTPNAR